LTRQQIDTSVRGIVQQGRGIPPLQFTQQAPFGKAKVERQKAKVEDERRRGFHPPLMKSTLPSSPDFCLLPFYFCLLAGAGMALADGMEALKQ
jgi:hypothetical protein